MRPPVGRIAPTRTGPEMETPIAVAADAGDGALRQCPTRVDGAPPLIVHLIPGELCAGRQRALYHKCASCEHAAQRGAQQPNAHALLQPRPRVSLPRSAPVALPALAPSLAAPALERAQRSA